MNKTYNIINPKNYDDSIDYFFYTIIILLIFYLVYLIIFNNLNIMNESFIIEKSKDVVNNEFKNINFKPESPEEIIKNLKHENSELISYKDKLNNLIDKQTRDFYLTNNFNKIDEKSFNDEINFVDTYFKDVKLPEIDISKFNVISTENKLEGLLNEAKTFKNIYAPGDKVEHNSDFNITKDDICYFGHAENIKNDPEFKKNIHIAWYVA